MCEGNIVVFDLDDTLVITDAKIKVCDNTTGLGLSVERRTLRKSVCRSPISLLLDQPQTPSQNMHSWYPTQHSHSLLFRSTTPNSLFSFTFFFFLSFVEIFRIESIVWAASWNHPTPPKKSKYRHSSTPWWSIRVVKQQTHKRIQKLLASVA